MTKQCKLAGEITFHYLLPIHSFNSEPKTSRDEQSLMPSMSDDDDDDDSLSSECRAEPVGLLIPAGLAASAPIQLYPPTSELRITKQLSIA